jgi:hypothetical protein
VLAWPARLCEIVHGGGAVLAWPDTTAFDPAEPGEPGEPGETLNRYQRVRATRFKALITALSDAPTIDSLTPTPHSTRSPTSISR